MKAYWKNHPALRMILMLVLFVLALVLVVSGWKMTGQLAGLGIMQTCIRDRYLFRWASSASRSSEISSR